MKSCRIIKMLDIAMPISSKRKIDDATKTSVITRCMAVLAWLPLFSQSIRFRSSFSSIRCNFNICLYSSWFSGFDHFQYA